MSISFWRSLVLFLLPLLWSCGASAVLSPIRAVPYSPPGQSNGPSRQLKAVSRRLDFLRRDQHIQRRFSADLRYAEECQLGGSSAFVSSVRINSEIPLLVLEDFEHLINHVKCTKSTIELRFGSSSDADAARHACYHEEGAYAVTSHFSCNDEGERSIFRIHGLNIADDGSSIVMDVTKTPFKEAFPTFEIEFGYTSEPHLFRRHDRVLRRQSPSSVITSDATASQTAHITSTRVHTIESTITTAPNFTVPSIVAPSTAASTATSAVIPLAFQELDSTFTLPPIPNNPLSKLPFTIGCKNCTTQGFLVLSAGKFTFDFNVEDPFDIIQAGNIELQVNDLSAHIELSAQPSKSAAFQHSLFTAPVVGFVIPGIAQAGVAFEAVVAVEFQLEGALELTYGFDITVPTGSIINIDFGSFNDSYIKGFESTTFTTLPFTFNLTNPVLSVTAAFRPTIPIGFSFGKDSIGGELTAQVSAFADLPSLSATISGVSNTDAACNALNATNSTLPAPYANSTLPASTIADVLKGLGPLILIEPVVAVDLVLGANFKADIAALPSAAEPLPLATALTIFATNFSLPTACLAFSSGFTPAAEVFAKETSSIVSSLSSASSASSASAAAAASASEMQKGQAGNGTGTAALATQTRSAGERVRAFRGWMTGEMRIGDLAVCSLIGVAMGMVML